MNKTRHNFTLLEILVAVAVLVIMMSFLFQFVISAQRVWAVSTARTYMADQANAVFQMMAEDFGQMVTVKEDENPDAVMGWYCYPKPKDPSPVNLKHLFFFAGDRDDADGAYYGVMYYYNHDEDSNDYGKLYRVRTPNPAWEKIGKTSTPGSNGDDIAYAEFGLPYNNNVFDNQNRKKWFTYHHPDGTPDPSHSRTTDQYVVASVAAEDPEKKLEPDDYVVAENVTEFKVQAAGETGNTTLPRFIRVTMKVQVPDDLTNVDTGEQVMERTFSRVFFLSRGE